MRSAEPLLTINWSVFVWALLNDRMMETSLGYYINPLVNILLGGLFLAERLRPLQMIAVVFASLGVLNELVLVGVLPLGGTDAGDHLRVLRAGTKKDRGGFSYRTRRGNRLDVAFCAWLSGVADPVRCRERG